MFIEHIPLFLFSISFLLLLGLLLIMRSRNLPFVARAPVESCDVSDVKASVLSDSYDRQSNTWSIQLTWSPPVGSCQQYVGYSVEVYYDTEGQWLGYNWVPSLSSTSISPALFPNTTQRYRVRPQSSPQRDAKEVGSWVESNSVGPQSSPPVAEEKSENAKKPPKKPATPDALKAKRQKSSPPRPKKKAPSPRNIVIVKRQDKKKPRGNG